MTVNFTFILIVSLLSASGFMLCASSDDPIDKEVKVTIHLDTNFHDEGPVKGREIKDRAVGIHLGMTHSSVAVFKHPRHPRIYCECCSESSNSDIYQLVLNEHGSRTTPSCVAFTDSGVLIGESAKDQAPDNPERTVCGIISLLGKRFDDPDVQRYIIKTLPYKVVNKENKPHVEIKFKNVATNLFSPEEICGMILGKMKELAEAYMGKKIENAAVLLHHSLFDKVNRTTVMEAGKMVGLFVDIVSSSRGATVLDRSIESKRVLVYNLVGSAFDVSLHERDDCFGSVFEVVASRGAAHLGGQAFDRRVVDYLVNLIKSKYNRDISEDMKALRKLEIECEKAKIALSSRDQVMIKIESLADGIGLFEEPLTRETFEELNMDLFNKTIDLVRAVLNEGSDIKKTHTLDGIVLVGGNAHIPKIQHMLKEELGIEPLKDVNPDEALAFAATHKAGAFSDRDEDIFGEMNYELYNIFVMPYAEKLMAGLLPSYSSQNISLFVFGQTRVMMTVFEGETPLTKYRRSLGRFEIYYPPSTSGEVFITVKTEVDVNANVRVTVIHGGSSNITSINIPAEQVAKSNPATGFQFRLLHRNHPEVVMQLGEVAFDDELQLLPLEKEREKLVYYGNFLVGSESESVLAVYDTGSSYTLLNPMTKSSSTYQPLACNEDLGAEVPGNTCIDNHCGFDFQYSDGTAVSGQAGIDQFRFFGATDIGYDPDLSATAAFDMVFGTMNQTMRHPGIMGVTDDPLGILSNLGVTAFSSCFPINNYQPGYVRFGEYEAILVGESITPLVYDQFGHFAFHVESITIQGVNLTFLTEDQQAQGARFTFDTGSAYTLLHPVAMEGVVEQVKKAVKAHAYYTIGGYELYYDPKDKPAYSGLEFRLNLDWGGSIRLNFSNIWVGYRDYYCLAFVKSSKRRTVYGVHQMRGWKFGIDTQYDMFHYNLDETCSME